MRTLGELPGVNVLCPHLSADGIPTKGTRFVQVGPNQTLVLCGICCDVLRGKFATEIVQDAIREAADYAIKAR